MKLHILKIRQEFFDAILNNEKRFEVRYNDRDYQKGDLIHFVNTDGKEFGEVRDTWGFKGPNRYYKEAVWRVEYILTYKDFLDGLKDGYVILGLTRLSAYHL